ncbi:calcium channel [Mucor ambiguus]|uniref:Calcium channel n=1 Tax=Mucor ambiguus TaxID=91626 RepID=A0A0C9MHP2_9FUNG|nr:calcium channel [Mucor ambiguus]
MNTQRNDHGHHTDAQQHHAIPQDYFTSVDMNREPQPPQADLTDLEPDLQDHHVSYAAYTPSPLQIDNEKWSVDSAQDVHCMYQHDSNATFIEGSPSFPQPHKNSVLEDKHEQELESSSDSSNDIDDDKDHDFDWNGNDGNSDKQSTRSVKQNTTFQRAKTLYRKYCFWHYLSLFMKRVVIAAIGSAIFITVGVCVYIYFPRPSPSEEKDPSFENIRDNIQVWMYWAAFMWHIAWLSTFMTDAVPYIVTKSVQFFKGRRSEKVKSYMEYYMSLKYYIGLLIITAWNWGTWAFLITIAYPKTIIQVVASRFHKFAFKDRAKANRRAIKILDALGKAEFRYRASTAASRIRNRKRPDLSAQSTSDFLDTATTTAAASSLGHTTGISPSVSTSEYMSGRGDLTSKQLSSSDLLYSFKKNLKRAVINEQPHVSRHMKKDMDINSDEYARKNAKKLYTSLAYPDGILPGENQARRCLLISDFEPYFKTAQDARLAFDIFDRDGNGDITRREFRDTVVHIYRERKDIAISMRDTGQALGKIDYMLLAISLVALLLTSFAIFNVEVWHSLVPLGSILLAMTFVFGNTAKNTFESILFLFVTHPYDAGDYVLVDGQYLLVHNMGVMGTSFVSGDGQLIYAPTTVLMTKLITNVRRSGSMGESIKINIDFRTTTDQFWKLHDRLLAWVTSQSRDFGPGFDLRVIDIVDVNQLILNIWLPHKGNWQELGKRFQRKTRFMLALKDIMTELNIRYELPAQRITQGVHPGEPHPAPLFGQRIEECPQSFSAHVTTTPTRGVSPSDPAEAKAYEEIRKNRAIRGDRYNMDLGGSASAGGDGGW